MLRTVIGLYIRWVAQKKGMVNFIEVREVFLEEVIFVVNI